MRDVFTAAAAGCLIVSMEPTPWQQHELLEALGLEGSGGRAEGARDGGKDPGEHRFWWIDVERGSPAVNMGAIMQRLGPAVLVIQKGRGAAVVKA